VEPGECLLVVGPSGAGKSTLALAIAGLVPGEFAGEWAGRLFVDGQDARALPRARIASRVGVVFQDPASQIVMDRVEDDVAFGLESRAWAPDAMRRRVPEALAEAGLLELARRRSTRLSGGQQQRLALAGVLAPRPGVLVLDEPTANLDPVGTAAFFGRLGRLRATRAATIVLVEHRVEHAWPLADRVLALGRDGRPIDLGAPDEVLARSGPRLAREGVWLPVTSEPTLAQRAPVPAGRPLATATDVMFGYDRRRPVVRDVTLELAAGERVAIVGPNGSGKSTLGQLIVGLLRPDAGTIRLDGADPARLRAAELARRAGLLFQDPEQQFLTASVGDEVMAGLRPAERRVAADLMARLGLPLETFGDRSPYTLSGGEKRRLSLACVLVRRPALFVLDEPTFGQDRAGYEGLLGILRDLVDAGACLVAATHDPRFVADATRRTLVLEAGRLVGEEIAA
jgi:energy-coupling factor transport system ATP-binding protein